MWFFIVSIIIISIIIVLKVIYNRYCEFVKEHSNLQTLCKRCNKNKSNIIEPVTSKTFNPNLIYCKACKAPLKIVNGKYGNFYGCSNYPKCDYREKI